MGLRGGHFDGLWPLAPALLKDSPADLGCNLCTHKIKSFSGIKQSSLARLSQDTQPRIREINLGWEPAHECHNICVIGHCNAHRSRGDLGHTGRLPGRSYTCDEPGIVLRRYLLGQETQQKSWHRHHIPRIHRTRSYAVVEERKRVLKYQV